MSDKAFLRHGSATVREILSTAEGKLAEACIENAPLDAEWIVSHVLGVRRLELPLIWDRRLDDKENKRIFDLLERRSTREPLQYALGNTFFADLIGCFFFVSFK